MTAAVSPSNASGHGPAPRTRHAPTSSTSSRAVRYNPQDALSDRVTSNLIRRTLCSQQSGDKDRDNQTPIEELLPPLTSRNDVDLQLYAFLSIILRDFVQSWYSRITTDEAFVAEILHTVAHCTRALEQRFRKVDLESLLLDEIPDLLDKHVTAYRVANRSYSQPPVETEPRLVYHSLCPLPYLSPVPSAEDEETVRAQRENEVAYRQLLVQAVLAILLPTEDLENPCLTSLVEQIFSELIIGNVVAGKISQPWMLFEVVCILVRVLEDKRKRPAESSLNDPSSSINRSVLDRKTERGAMHGFFLALINIAMLITTTIRLLASTALVSSSVPSRFSVSETYDEKGHSERDAEGSPKAPILTFKAWSFVGNLIELPSRMPWLSGFLSLLQYGGLVGPGLICGLDGTIDRLVSYHIRSLCSPADIPTHLRTIRGLLFPNNALGKSTLMPPSSDAELHALRRRAASAVLSLLPTKVGRMYLGGRWFAPCGVDIEEEEKEMVDEVESMLMVLSDEYCNKHLMYEILELVLVRLMPELTRTCVEDLWDERLG